MPSVGPNQAYLGASGQTETRDGSKLGEVALHLLLEEAVGNVAEVDDGARRRLLRGLALFLFLLWRFLLRRLLLWLLGLFFLLRLLRLLLSLGRLCVLLLFFGLLD